MREGSPREARSPYHILDRLEPARNPRSERLHAVTTDGTSIGNK
jgi:hypothetical protein